MGVSSLPKTVTRQRRNCDLNPGPSAPESSTLTTRLPSYPSRVPIYVVHRIRRRYGESRNTFRRSCLDTVKIVQFYVILFQLITLFFPQRVTADYVTLQEVPLSPRDRAMRRVN